MESRTRMDPFAQAGSQVVNDDDVMPQGYVSVNDVRSDEAASACDKNLSHTGTSDQELRSLSCEYLFDDRYRRMLGRPGLDAFQRQTPGLDIAELEAERGEGNQNLDVVAVQLCRPLDRF